MSKVKSSGYAKTVLFLFACILFSVVVSAGEEKKPATGIQAVSAIDNDANFVKGLNLFNAGEFRKAYDEFFKVFEKNPGSFKVNFYLGRAAFEMGDYEAAVMAFDRILTINPNMPRVKLELGRSYFKLGSYDMAKQYFNEVLATKPPEDVKKVINAFVNMMEAKKKRHFFNGLISFNMSYDDNIRSTPENNTVQVPAAGYANVSLNKERDAMIYGNTLVLSHKYRFQKYPWSWKTTMVNLNSWYNEGERDGSEDGLDLNYLNITTGPTLELNQFIMDFQFGVTNMEQDYQTYLKSYVIGTNMTIIINNNFLFSTGLRHEHKKLYQTRNRDADNLELSFSPMFFWGKNRFTFRGTFGSEGTGCEMKNNGVSGEYESYKKTSATFRYDRQLPWDVTAFGSYRFVNTNYTDTSILFRRERKDNQHDFTIGFSKRINDKISFDLSHTHSKSFSNIGLYRYSRDVTAFSLSYSF